MSCSSPRASTGFKMLAASIAPSAAPAPTMVWNSSTKRMALPSRTSSSSRFLNRSSKSPRYFVPATRLAMSRASRRRPGASGVPACRRCAGQALRPARSCPRPVPHKAGLFFWRRHKISTIRSSSFPGRTPGPARRPPPGGSNRGSICRWPGCPAAATTPSAAG